MAKEKNARLSIIGSASTSIAGELIPIRTKFNPVQFEFVCNNFLKDYFVTVNSKRLFDDLIPILSYKPYFDFVEGSITQFI
jgi:hypothetical protein